MNRKQERAAWTQFVTGTSSEKSTKYQSERAGKYASKHEADVATKLFALQAAGKIWNLKEQDSIVLVPGDDQVRGIIYRPDFTYDDAEGHHILDAKGVRTPVYQLKKRLAWLLHKIKIEEV
jgi:hypothetical protein